MTTLPKSRVLSYVTRINTPSRVRVIAAWTLLILGVLFILGFAALAWLSYSLMRAHFAPEEFAYLFGGPPPMAGWSGWGRFVPRFSSRSEPLWEMLRFLLTDTPFAVALLLLLLGVVSVIIFAPLKRGRRWAAIAGMPVALFTLLLSLFAALPFFAAALTAAIPVFGPRANPLMLFFLIPFALAVVATCLCLDLMGFLLWIARNPEVEKPPKKSLG